MRFLSIFTTAIALSLASPTLAQVTSDLDKFEVALSEVGTSAIIMADAGRERGKALAVVDAAKQEAADARTRIAEANSWLSTFQPGLVSESTQASRNTIIEQVSVMLSAEKQLVKAVATLMTKEAAFQRTAEMHAAAKAEIINQVYDAVAAEQAYTAQVQKKLNTERKLA